MKYVCKLVYLVNQNHATFWMLPKILLRLLLLLVKTLAIHQIIIWVLFSVPQTTLSTAAVVGIAVGSVIALIIGVVAGALLFYCIRKHWCQSSKAKTSSHQQQPAGLLLRSFVPAVLRENWFERDCGLWTCTDYWVGSKWSLLACVALIFVIKIVILVYLLVACRLSHPPFVLIKQVHECRCYYCN